MNKLRDIVILGLAIVFLGCSNGDKDKETTPSNNGTPVVERILEHNVKMEVLSGEVYEARSEDALIDIEHDLVNNKRYVLLIQGEGVIIEP